ncbi:hypothetical protein ACOB87_00295 [Streptomyces sp. YS-B37]
MPTVMRHSSPIRVMSVQCQPIRAAAVSHTAWTLGVPQYGQVCS